MHVTRPHRPSRPDSDSEEAAALRLALARGVGPVAIDALRRAFGSARAAVDASTAAVSAALHLDEPRASRLVGAIRRADPWHELRRVRRARGSVLHPAARHWPPLLRLLEPPPPLLWCRGGPPDGDRAVAIVGSRRAGRQALERAADLAAGLVDDGWTIVSGGAIGIDAAAHRGALRAGGRTIVVLGGGLDRPSPRSHAPLFREVLANGGAVLSEWPMETEPRPHHFPRRNRVIAGLARAVLVVAAGERSGAHVTARLAVEELGRDVGAVPGDPDDPLARGCLRLLREGAAVIRDVDDARELLAGTEAIAVAARSAASAASEAAAEAGADAPGRPSPRPPPVAQPSSASPSASSITTRSCRSRAVAEDPR